MTTLITGASSGIGYELARICARNGHHLVLVSRKRPDLSDPDFADANATVIVLDLSEPDAATKLMQRIKQKRLVIDNLINNAGFGDYAEFAETDLDKLEQMMQLNIITLTELTRLLLPSMKERGYGRVMNVASIAAFLPGPLMAVYYATKHYVLTLSESIAEELAGSGVTVTALCPGPTASGFQAAASMESSPLVKGKTLPTAEDVAKFGFAAMMQGRRIAIHGRRNRLVAFIVRFLPRAFVARFVKSASRT